MQKKDQNALNHCKIEAVVSIDKRGQMVLPKEIREKAQIRAGDKLAIVTGEKRGGTCCIAIIKSSKLGKTLENILKTLGIKNQNKAADENV